MNPARFPFYIVAIFTLLCGAIGGSARADEPLLIPVRLAGIAALIALILIPSPAERRPVAPLHFLLATLAAVIALQLIPLPPAIWEAIPGHARFVDAATFAGIAQPWRPISIVPDLTANSLMALLPAVVVLVGYTKIGIDRRTDMIKLLCIVGFANILVGALQMVGGPQSAAYYYERISRGTVSGMFSNRNHFAVYLALMVPLLTYLVFTSKERDVDQRLILSFGFLVLLFIIVLASGSRSGAAVLVISSLLTALSFWRDFKGIKRLTALSTAALAVSGAAILFLAYYWNRALSIDRFQALSTDEMRLRSLPVVARMVRDFLPFGTGFGTFDAAFRIYEPDGFLNPVYFNNAHDDWLEIVLTGGIPAVLVTLLFVAWYARAGYRVFRYPSQSKSDAHLGRVVVIVIAGMGIASLSDYPVRTPMFTLFLAITSCLLSDVAGRGRRGITDAGTLLPTSDRSAQPLFTHQ